MRWLDGGYDGLLVDVILDEMVDGGWDGWIVYVQNEYDHSFISLKRLIINHSLASVVRIVCRNHPAMLYLCRKQLPCCLYHHDL